MLILLFLLITIAALLFLLEPYIRGHQATYLQPEHSAESKKQNKSEEFADKKQALKVSLKDLEHEFSTGKMSEPDYKLIRNDLLLEWKNLEDKKSES